jgi:hypothetical protein
VDTPPPLAHAVSYGPALLGSEFAVAAGVECALYCPTLALGTAGPLHDLELRRRCGRRVRRRWVVGRIRSEGATLSSLAAGTPATTTASEVQHRTLSGSNQMCSWSTAIGAWWLCSKRRTPSRLCSPGSPIRSSWPRSRAWRGRAAISRASPIWSTHRSTTIWVAQRACTQVGAGRHRHEFGPAPLCRQI